MLHKLACRKNAAPPEEQEEEEKPPGAPAANNKHEFFGDRGENECAVRVDNNPRTTLPPIDKTLASGSISSNSIVSKRGKKSAS